METYLLWTINMIERKNSLDELKTIIELRNLDRHEYWLEVVFMSVAHQVSKIPARVESPRDSLLFEYCTRS